MKKYIIIGLAIAIISAFITQKVYADYVVYQRLNDAGCQDMGSGTGSWRRVCITWDEHEQVNCYSIFGGNGAMAISCIKK